MVSESRSSRDKSKRRENGGKRSKRWNEALVYRREEKDGVKESKSWEE